MLMSTDRILVSHVGSLPRAEPLTDLLIRQEASETIDAAELARQVETATAHVNVFWMALVMAKNLERSPGTHCNTLYGALPRVERIASGLVYLKW